MHGTPLMVKTCSKNTQVLFRDYLKRTLRKPVILVKVRIQTISEPGQMTRRIKSPVILINHWRWLEANGYRQQAASCKLQAASLTRKNYRIIKEYENKRST